MVAEKPRLIFLRELHGYRDLKRVYYQDMCRYEEAQQRAIMEEIEAIEAGLPPPPEPDIKAPAHPLCPSRYAVDGE